MNDPRYIVNVEAAIFAVDRWLMIERGAQEMHAAGTLSMVGGKVEATGQLADALETTLRREIREEIGVEVADVMHYVESKTFTLEDGRPVVDIVFLCTYHSGEPRALDPAEVADVRWMSLAEILRHPKTPPWIKDSLQRADHKRLALQALS